VESEEITKEMVVLEGLRGREAPPTEGSLNCTNQHTAQLLGAEYQRRTGEAGFGFLEFGDVDWCDVEALSIETGTCAREGSRENDGVAKGEGIGGVGLGGIDVDPVVAGE